MTSKATPAAILAADPIFPALIVACAVACEDAEESTRTAYDGGLEGPRDLVVGVTRWYLLNDSMRRVLGEEAETRNTSNFTLIYHRPTTLLIRMGTHKANGSLVRVAGDDADAKDGPRRKFLCQESLFGDIEPLRICMGVVMSKAGPEAVVATYVEGLLEAAYFVRAADCPDLEAATERITSGQPPEIWLEPIPRQQRLG